MFKFQIDYHRLRKSSRVKEEKQDILFKFVVCTDLKINEINAFVNEIRNSIEYEFDSQRLVAMFDLPNNPV